MPTDLEWLTWLKALPAHDAIAKIGTAVKQSRFAVTGMLVALWNTYDEDVPLPATEIDEVAGCPGFARALVDTGWAVPCVGGLEFPVFDKYVADQAALRKDGATRTAQSRRNALLAEQALAIYKAYPRQVGRARAVMEIRIALAQGKVDYETLLGKTQEFKASVAHLKTKEERQMIPLPSTFYHQERWDDRPEDRPTAQCETDRLGRVESPEE